MSVQQGQPQHIYRPEPVRTVDDLTLTLGFVHPSLKGYEVNVKLPDGTYREIKALSTSDDRIVILLDDKEVSPYDHDE